MTILIVPGTHANGETYYAVGPLAFRSHGDAVAFLLYVLESI